MLIKTGSAQQMHLTPGLVVDGWQRLAAAAALALGNTMVNNTLQGQCLLVCRLLLSLPARWCTKLPHTVCCGPIAPHTVVLLPILAVLTLLLLNTIVLTLMLSHTVVTLVCGAPLRCHPLPGLHTRWPWSSNSWTGL